MQALALLRKTFVKTKAKRRMPITPGNAIAVLGDHRHIADASDTAEVHSQGAEGAGHRSQQWRPARGSRADDQQILRKVGHQPDHRTQNASDPGLCNVRLGEQGVGRKDANQKHNRTKNQPKRIIAIDAWSANPLAICEGTRWTFCTCGSNSST